MIIILQLLSVITLTLLFSWESKDVKITTLDQEEYNHRNKVYYFVGVACGTIVYAIIMTTLGLLRIRIPPKAVRQ